ncbi:TetR/AcrR family transcriptional regulator [Pseudonocardia acaciae]|uniref:TetR/AcrR family transcriptional regulator n=1 Tax=Pseudonocardia acaciae TaxID=551276 RepID=UPI00048C8765|nr:TetR/AcrR family transcriptional regulator [Pseudonocardia acaciae]
MRSERGRAETRERGGHHGNRHGRSELARRAVLRAVDDLLVERGYAALTMEGIAAEAGVAKQTIYRWWRSKNDVLMEAFLDDAAKHLAPPDHGDVGPDLREHLRRVARFLADSDPGAVFAALIGQAQHDPEFAAEFRGKFLTQQRERDRLPLARAIERGQLPDGLDVELALDQLLGPVHYRILVAGEPVPPEYTDELVDQFLRLHARPA